MPVTQHVTRHKPSTLRRLPRILLPELRQHLPAEYAQRLDRPADVHQQHVADAGRFVNLQPGDDFLGGADQRVRSKKEGILVGISAGANVFAAQKIAQELGPGKNVVTILCDTGERYISIEKYFNI